MAGIRDRTESKIKYEPASKLNIKPRHHCLEAPGIVPQIGRRTVVNNSLSWRFPFSVFNLNLILTDLNVNILAALLLSSLLFDDREMKYFF